MLAYGINTMLGAIGSLISLGIVLRTLGPTDWAVIAVGQSVAAIGATISGWGWAVIGTASIATMSEDDARDELHVAILGRLAVLAPVSVLAAALAAVVASDRPVLAAVTAASFSAAGLSSAWYFVGRGDPAGLLLRDTIPRQLGMLVGAGMVSLSGEALFFPLVSLAGMGVSVLMAEGCCSPRDRPPTRIHAVNTRLRAQSSALVAAVASVAYLNAPVLVISLTAPQALPAYALAERIFKMANTATNPLTQHLQSELPRKAAEAPHLLRTSPRLPALLGLFSAVALLVIYAPASDILSGGRVTIGLPLAGCFCVVLLATTVSQVVGQSALIVLGATRHLGVSAVLGAIVGLPLMIAGGALIGGLGVAIALLSSEILVTCYQLIILQRETRS